LIPRWAGESVDDPNEGGGRDYADALRMVLANDKRAEVLNTDVDHQIIRRGGPENIVIMEYPDKRLVGKTLAKAALAAEISARDMVYRLQMEGFTDRLGGVGLRGYSMSEEDVEAFAAQPWVMTASDAGLALPGDPNIHARFYGTFPRKIRRYAIERKLLSVEQAVRSMTGLPAQVLGLRERGLVKEGFAADLAVIDLATIRDTNDFFNPHSYPEGIDYVLIGGEFVVDAGELAWALPGKVLTPTEQ
jgi:N-acyl-D-aspartate/D-glutamate deacylase